MKIAYIYTLTDPRTGFVRYVGKTVNKHDRRRSHFYALNKEQNPKALWVRELKSIGLKPIMEDLESVPYEIDNQWGEAERFWISTLRFYGFNLLNKRSGGNCGSTADDETKEKIRIACTVRMTESERKHLSMKCTGWKQTEEVKEFIAASKRNKARPVEVNAAFQAGSKDWKESMGYRTTRFCVHCNGVIKYNFLKSGERVPDLHFYKEGTGYIHNKCKKIYANTGS